MKLVIIGGGVAGLGIGWRLAQAGAQVTVLERGQPASGASWASAGMIAVTAELDDAPQPEADFANYSNGLWPDFAAELERASGQPIGYRRNGALIAATTPAEQAALHARATGAGTEWMSGAAAQAKAPMLTGDILGALWAHDEAQVDSRALGVALAVAFVRVGGKLVTNEPVIRIEHSSGRAIAARTSFGLYEADVFLLAAGAWSALVEEALSIIPMKGEMIALAPPPGGVLPEPVLWGHGIYAVPRGGRLLVGATMEEAGFDTHLTAAARTGLRRSAEQLMPGLTDWTLTDHWAGLRPKSRDGLPLLGPTATDGLFVAGGQFRNGILFTPAIADHMRDLLLGRATVIPAFDPRRFT